MKKTGIFYGSTTGTTYKVAQRIGSLMKVDPNDIFDISKVSPSKIGDYEFLLFGSSTWGNGNLQEDWLDFGNAVKAMDLRDKTIALFGTGNDKMAKTFCNAVGKLEEIVKDTGAKIIGQINAEGYNFKSSLAQMDGLPLMKGLVIDEINHSDLTDKRLKDWVQLLNEELA